MFKTASNGVRSKPKAVFMQDETFDILGFLSLIRSKIAYAFLMLVLGGILSGVITKFFIKPTYSATTKLYVVSSSGDALVNFSDLQVGESLTSDYEELILTRPILESVIRNLGLEDVYTYDELKETITITNPDDTRILNITVNTHNPQYSMDIANELADQAVNKLDDLMDTAPPNIAERAVYPERQTSPNMIKNILIGCIIFSAGYIMILFVMFTLDNKINNEDDVEKYLGIPPIGVIPDMSKK